MSVESELRSLAERVARIEGRLDEMAAAAARRRRTGPPISRDVGTLAERLDGVAAELTDLARRLTEQ